MNRFKVAWHVLRGRPVIWKMRLEGPIRIQPRSKDVLITDCHITGGYSVTFKHNQTLTFKETDGREESGPLEI